MCNELSSILKDYQNGIKTANLSDALANARNQSSNISSEQSCDNSNYLATMGLLYKAVKSQNDTMLKEINVNLDIFSTDDQKVYYQSQQIQTLKKINMIFLVIYYLLFLVVVYFIFYVDQKMTLNTKRGLTAFFLLYPWIMNPIVLFLYRWYFYFYALINGQTYSPQTG